MELKVPPRTSRQESVQALLIMMLFNNQRFASGTGFVVNGPKGPLLITNRHNVTGRHQETGDPLNNYGASPNVREVVHNVKGKLGNWQGKKEVPQ